MVHIFLKFIQTLILLYFPIYRFKLLFFSTRRFIIFGVFTYYLAEQRQFIQYFQPYHLQLLLLLLLLVMPCEVCVIISVYFSLKLHIIHCIHKHKCVNNTILGCEQSRESAILCIRGGITINIKPTIAHTGAITTAISTYTQPTTT